MSMLEDLRKGDRLSWDSRGWEVTDRTRYRGSSDYFELQWELEGRNEVRYLIMSRENKGGAVEEIWVCTAQAGIGQVERQVPGGWTSFREKDSMEAPPQRVRFKGLEYALEGETQGEAEDDDGDTVNKLTWDYYDPSRRKNLAVEVWQEPDADYYEAYDGTVVKPADFTRLPSRRMPLLGKDALSNAAGLCFASIFMLPVFGGLLSSAGVGAEYLVALALPVAALGLSVSSGAHGGLLAASSVLGVAAAAAALKFLGTGAPYPAYALCALAAGPLATELSARFFYGLRGSDKVCAASCASLLTMFVAGFAHYTIYAPRPHNLGLLIAACALTLPPAAAVFLVYLFKGGPDEQA